MRRSAACPGSSARTTWVSVRSSVIGISVTPGCQRWHSAAVAADSGCPAASMLVRTMCVAKSLSPRLNQSGPDQPEPAVGLELGQDGERVGVPAPALLLADPAAERVHHGVQVGRDVQAEQGDVVPGIADDGDIGVRGLSLQPAQEARGPDSACQHGDAHGGQSCNPGSAGFREPPGKPVSRGRNGPWRCWGLKFLGGLSRHQGQEHCALPRIQLDATQDTRV